MTAQAKAKLEKEKEDVEFAIENLNALEEEMKSSIAQLESEWKEKKNEITEINITPLKKDIFVEFFGIAWVPYYIVDVDGRKYRNCAFSK
jgi:hypothetical protein